jgi:hypothetical protein
MMTINSTDHNHFGEANILSTSQEIPRLACNRKVHYRVHKSPPPPPADLNQRNEKSIS